MPTRTAHDDFANRLATAYGEMLDGVRPALQRVSLRVTGEGRQCELEVKNRQTGVLDYWRVSKLRIVPDQATSDALVLARQEGDPARLIIRDRDTARAVLAACPRIAQLGAARGAWPKIIGLGAAALAAIVAILFLLVPAMADRGAQLVPPEVEVALGEDARTRTIAALGATECKGAEGERAIRRMTDRLSVGLDLPYPLTVRVVDDPMVNAFAFAGGHIAIFRGLIDTAETPDEVAAVLAHEIGHVVHRDATRSGLRMVGSFGIAGLIFGDVLGTSGAAGLGERYLRTSYSREAEVAADAFAHRQMERAGLDPGALASFFLRLQAESGQGEAGVLRHFSTHPELLDRVEAVHAAGPGPGTGRAALSTQDWQALRAICR